MSPESNVVPLRGPEPWLSIAQLAEHLSVSERTINRWVREGCPSETWGLAARRFQASTVLRWASQRTRRAS